ncbi:MAG: hypothetical protein R3D00_20950 [Bacteroidia bacterium]
MYKIPAIFILLPVFAFFSCKKNTQQSGDKIPDPPVATETPPSAISPKEKITGILLAYYNDLSNEELDETKYFAPTLNKFFNSEDISREKVANSVRAGFKTMDNRSIYLNNKSLQIIPSGDGYIAEFSGVSAYTPAGKTEKVEQLFSNRVSFNKDFLITGYEAIENPSANTLNREGQSASQMDAAKAILGAIRSGNPEKATAYIHPQKGFYLLTQPGAVSVPYFCNNLSDIYQYAPWMKKGKPELDAQPVEAKLPDFDCGDLFSKQGCFMANVSGYKDISSLMRSLRELQLGNYDDAQIAKATDIESFVSVQIIDTDANLGFLLGLIDGKWYLLIMDMATYECSA